MSKPIPRQNIDLKQLPIWLQYTIALSVTTIVVITAWQVGHNQPTPQWINQFLIPTLGWIYLVLLGYGVLSRLFLKK
jgi:hypothetical protein